ncbi:CLUMA_CG003259, isoform A [Clunio marinus]|uniref:CLUMA_CG003259, isoform A n=1 Tax=Clunio marinus TaxID=568069 RepID=A0A1J1HQC8_9DIPT|nr:CLUMA_CG003259, isoform A [Clunio marinus]
MTSSATFRPYEVFNTNESRSESSFCSTLIPNHFNSDFLRQENSAKRVGHDYLTDSDEETSSEDENKKFVTKPSSMKFTRIIKSPEELKKQQEAYNKWLLKVKEREKELKRISQEKQQALMEASRKLELEKKIQSEEKVKEWLEIKRMEAENKKLQQKKNKEKAQAKIKPKEYKIAINYNDWINRKNEEFIAIKTMKEKKEKVMKDYETTRKSISASKFQTWLRSSSSKSKPVASVLGSDASSIASIAESLELVTL